MSLCMSFMSFFHMHIKAAKSINHTEAFLCIANHVHSIETNAEGSFGLVVSKLSKTRVRGLAPLVYGYKTTYTWSCANLGLQSTQGPKIRGLPPCVLCVIARVFRVLFMNSGLKQLFIFENTRLAQ